MIAASARIYWARGRYRSNYLNYRRKTHQAEASTSNALAAQIESNMVFMRPRRRMARVRMAKRLRCAAPPLGARRCTVPLRRARSLRSGRTGWRRPAQTGFHQNPCPHAHGGRCHGRKHGGRHKQSWQWGAGWPVVQSGSNYKCEFVALAIELLSRRKKIERTKA